MKLHEPKQIHEKKLKITHIEEVTQNKDLILHSFYVQILLINLISCVNRDV